MRSQKQGFFFLITFLLSWQIFAFPAGIEPFNTNPQLLQYVNQLVGSSAIKSTPDLKQKYNYKLEVSGTKTLEKYVRSQTPSTVRMMVGDLLQTVDGLKTFTNLGMVVGDPHDGNFGTQADLFLPNTRDHNTYRVVDLDEMGVGIMILDFSRYMVYLKAKATYGELPTQFVQDLFAAYNKGLQLQDSVTVPDFIKENLQKTPQEIREKVAKYANERVDRDGKFIKAMYKDDLEEFKTKNMKPDFLKLVGFDREEGDKQEFKDSIERMIIKGLQEKLGRDIDVLDIAIPSRDSGGSAQMQRFLVSTHVKVDGMAQSLIVELKQNSENSAWAAAVKSPLQNSEDRYTLGLRITSKESGPLSGIIKFGKASFLMRVKGGFDVKSKGDERAQALFNAYFMGLFHGSQGPQISGPYVKSVLQMQPLFQKVVLNVTNEVTMYLIKESGNNFQKK